MPQPLSSLLKEHENRIISFGSTSLSTAPELTMLIPMCIASWSKIEHSLATTLVHILGAHATPSFAMFSALSSTTVQFATIRAAANSALSGRELEAFNVAMNISQTMAKERNKLAHWIWGHSPNIPDALLLADPNYLLEHKIKEEKFHDLANANPIAVALKSVENPYALDLDRIFVYRKGDLERLLRDLGETESIIHLLTLILSPRRATSHDELYRQLSSLHLFDEAQTRLRERQKKNPQAQP